MARAWWLACSSAEREVQERSRSLQHRTDMPGRMECKQCTCKGSSRPLSVVRQRQPVTGKQTWIQLALTAAYRASGRPR